MTTARLNPGIPLLLNGVTKRYGENTILNALDLHIPTGQFVAVVGLFRHPDRVNNTWKQVLRREDLDPDKPRILEAGNNHLTLQPRKDD